jgi:hypothetical protein
VRRLLRYGVPACVAALLVMSGCVITEGNFKFRGTEVTSKSVDLGGIEVVEFILGSEDVVIETDEVQTAEFMIKKTYRAREREYGEGLLKEAEILFNRHGDRLVVERKKEKDLGITRLSKGYVSIDIAVGLPADIRLEVDTGSGDVEIADRSAPVKVDTGSGDVRMGEASSGLEVSTGSGDMIVEAARQSVNLSAGSGDITVGGVGGKAELHTGSGDVTVRKLTGEAEVSTGSGDVEISNSSGSVKAVTGSGDIEMSHHSGSTDLNTSSGDVDLGIDGGDGDIGVKTSSGEVDIVVYGGDAYEVEIATSSGSISSRLPLTVRDASRRKLSGHYGSGGFNLRVTTSSGGVSIVRGAI